VQNIFGEYLKSTYSNKECNFEGYFTDSLQEIITARKENFVPEPGLSEIHNLSNKKTSVFYFDPRIFQIQAYYGARFQLLLLLELSDFKTPLAQYVPM
jgi:hypothetical protein